MTHTMTHTMTLTMTHTVGAEGYAPDLNGGIYDLVFAAVSAPSTQTRVAHFNHRKVCVKNKIIFAGFFFFFALLFFSAGAKDRSRREQ